MKSQVYHLEVRPQGKKVFVGMSGGVDSAVSAALLLKSGFDVTCVFIKVWQPDWIECTWKEERIEAMRVAAHLGIPFITLDLEKEYKKDVVDYMINEYKIGRTPNPDVMCNKSVKFGAFYDWTMKNGADYVATGHYAQIKNPSFSKGDSTTKAALSVMSPRPQGSDVSIPGHASPSADGALTLADVSAPWGPSTDTSEPRGLRLIVDKETPRFQSLQLLAGTDSSKDQSYFLWNIRTEQLPHILFPVGHLNKPEVRKLALKFKLPNAEKKDSQGICFIGQVDMKEFLSHYIETKEGDVLNESGTIIGRHPGALLFTIGERHGFTVTKKTPDEKPYFVINKDVINNTISVRTDRKIPADTSNGNVKINNIVKIEQTNWIGEAPKIGDQIQARTRYRQTLEEVIVSEINYSNNTAVVEFKEKQKTITPGQSLVLYDGERCDGGGIITE